MDDEEVSFLDADTRGSNKHEKLNFKEIVLSHLKKIGTFASCEFRGGFWEERPHPNINLNETLKTYIIDSREVYSNSVEYLFDILFPHFDKKMQEEGVKIEKELEDLYKDKTIIKEQERVDKNFEEGKKEDRKFSDVKDRISYRTQRMKINRKLFRALCCFLKRIDYLKGESLDEVSK